MRRFALPPECATDGIHTLSGKPFHYLCRVRRSPVGTRLDALDDGGGRYRVTIREIGAQSCSIEVSTVSREPESLPGPRIVLYQGLPKGRKLEQIIRQCTEAGVAAIHPFTSRFTVAEAVAGQRGDTKLERWATIAREAVQQSGRSTIPVINPPIEITDIPDIGADGELGLLFHQEPLEHDSLHGYLEASPHTVAIVIGGEGGFSPSEVDVMTKQKGYRLAHLGPAVLRTETAAVYAVAAVQTILREIEAWSKR